MVKYVVPAVTEGLVEVCKIMPDDPIDYLAQYLFEKAGELPNLPS